MSEPLFIPNEGIDDLINRFHEYYIKLATFYRNLPLLTDQPNLKPFESMHKTVIEIEAMAKVLSSESFEEKHSTGANPSLQSYIDRAMVGGITVDAMLNFPVFLSDTEHTTIIQAAKEEGGVSAFKKALRAFARDATDYYNFQEEIGKYFDQEIIEEKST